MPRFTIVLLIAAVVGVLSAAVVLERFGAESFFPGLVAGFLGSLGAFVLALTWERERDLRRDRANAKALAEQLIAEVQRRLEPVVAELEKNSESVRFLHDLLRGVTPSGEAFVVANPQLLEGAWTASAPRLSDVVADFKLIADLSVLYGRLEELRWRIRYRTEHQSAALDNMIAPLVRELMDEIDDLLVRVRQQIGRPLLQPPMLRHARAIGGTPIET